MGLDSEKRKKKKVLKVPSARVEYLAFSFSVTSTGKLPSTIKKNEIHCREFSVHKIFVTPF